MLDGLEHLGYIGLFIASYLSATVLPFISDVVFGGIIASGLHVHVWICIIAATIGSTLGGMTCYWIGSRGKVEWAEKYMRIKRGRIEKMQKWLQGKGSTMCVFAGIPGMGDFVAIALGLMRANLWSVLFFLALGKFVRYTVTGLGFAKIFGVL
ncbi:MAG: VTT domain-containing protein [Dysgonamonadaceae bacterium]|jgi:membrane protein YqaA with SNARE-associated domain|nr:VTT domain-containing protein [Dysgonamonadaceae bacterium]